MKNPKMVSKGHYMCFMNGDTKQLRIFSPRRPYNYIVGNKIKVRDLNTWSKDIITLEITKVIDNVTFCAKEIS